MQIPVVSAEDLYKSGEIDPFEIQGCFADKTIMKFPSAIQAYTFAAGFVHGYLIPKYGKEQAAKFPMAKSSPLRDADEAMDEIVGIKKRNPKQETWLVISNDRYH